MSCAWATFLGNCAFHLLQSGVDTTVIAPWLVHEPVNYAHAY
jgi:hypothetical protein